MSREGTPAVQPGRQTETPCPEKEKKKRERKKKREKERKGGSITEGKSDCLSKSRESKLKVWLKKIQKRFRVVPATPKAEAGEGRPRREAGVAALA